MFKSAMRYLFCRISMFFRYYSQRLLLFVCQADLSNSFFGSFDSTYFMNCRR